MITLLILVAETRVVVTIMINGSLNSKQQILFIYIYLKILFI